MLFTRCPECDTTFRVTDETLKKASGQVRCGRCASVFNAYSELHDPSAKSFEAEPTSHPIASPAPVRAPPAEPVSAAATPAETPRDAAVFEPAADPSEPATPPQPGAATAGNGMSVADLAAETKIAAADAEAPVRGDAAPAADAEAISAKEVDRVLTVEQPVPQPVHAWQGIGGSSLERPRSRWWTAAAALALLALAAQAVHHSRSRLAAHATFGPWVTAAYEALGSEVTPRWDVHQYQIIDWVATAEPNARGLGSLKITARIKNRGASRQPYPAVQLRLKDRYEGSLGSRLFTPAEYLPSDTPRGRWMSPGETTRAQIEVVDPGPDAYGFELDVCIEVEASLVTCGADEVFL